MVGKLHASVFGLARKTGGEGITFTPGACFFFSGDGVGGVLLQQRQLAVVTKTSNGGRLQHLAVVAGSSDGGMRPPLPAVLST
ncbi:transporter [Sesbania bispinosa]|nr:transporter [Sesbania bispinosa]